MDSLTSYIKKGEKGFQTGQIGLEVEHFIIHKETGKVMEYDQIAQMFEQLAPYYSTSTYEQGNRIALENHWVLITLEPGCQLELSIRCTDDLCKIYDKYKEAITPISNFVSQWGYEIVYSGGLPTLPQEKVKRIDKERYHLMEEYFKSSGTRGLEMMKATAAIHVSIDYADEKDFIDKVRIANILHPLFMFLSSNTPMYAGKKNEDVLLRDSIWHHTDEKRCRIIEDLFSEDFGYSSYANYVLDTPMILMHHEDQFISVGDQTGRDLIHRYGDSDGALSHYLSMVFPDIRIKRFIEIRSADSMPIDATMAYCALLKGIFYQPNIFEDYLQLTHDIQEIQDVKETIRNQGWDGMIYGMNVQVLCLKMIEDAKKGLTPCQQKCMILLENVVKQRKHIGDFYE